MANIQKQQVIDQAINKLGLQMIGDKIPSISLDHIVPVISVDMDFADYLKSVTYTTTGTSTFFTAPTDQDFFMTGYTYGVVKDAANDCTEISFSTNTGLGVITKFFTLPCFTTTLLQQNGNVNFTTPIKISKGRTITIGKTFTVGTISITIGIFGFYR